VLRQTVRIMKTPSWDQRLMISEQSLTLPCSGFVKILEHSLRVESHQRQLVDASDPTYTRGHAGSMKSHQRKLVDCSDPANFNASCRLDLKYPPTAVGGISSKGKLQDVGWI
jgi:hypothetical protein